MWHELLEGDKFIGSIYNKVPELKKVRINGIKIRDEGRKITIEFDMPTYAETPPKKWADYNSVFVEVDIFDIYEVNIQSVASRYKADIEFYKDENNLLNVKIDGSVKAFIKADMGLIQSVQGYLNG